MRTHPFLLINPVSGGGRPSVDELAAAAREHGIEPHLLESGEDPGALRLLVPERTATIGEAMHDNPRAAESDE
jgi:hypothetical protein